MKKASELERGELIQIVEQIQSLLYLNTDSQGDHWDRHKEWDSETIEYVANVLVDAGLAPDVNSGRRVGQFRGQEWAGPLRVNHGQERAGPPQAAIR